MTITIIGTGLIGGSMAIALKEKGIASRIIGADASAAHLQKALSFGLIDEAMDWQAAVDAAELVIVAIPVDRTAELLPALLDRVQHQAVMDVGSTKQAICNAVRDHPKRKRFVASHPMWGTERNGPEAAVKGAFIGKAAVICDKEQSHPGAVEIVESVYHSLGMHILYMDAAAHDIHAAYISHVSHITSFALANTVLEKEKEESTIFEMASGGFESTVRLAKSHAAMWVPIFMQNKDNVLDVLNEHITQLRKFKSCLEKENYEYLQELIDHANRIRRIV